MDSALTPREIQSRIRAGESIEDVARAAGVPVDNIEGYAAPVLAEREHMAAEAQSAQVRRTEGPSTPVPLGEAIAPRLQGKGIDPQSVLWDAWRDEDRADRHWTVRVSYQSGSTGHEALFDFDPRGRYASPVNADAQWLAGQQAPHPRPRPRPRTPSDPDTEPTVDLNDELALVRAVQDDETPIIAGGSALAELYAAAAANHIEQSGDNDNDGGLKETNGVYDIVSNPPSDMDVLYDMLSGFEEDSVHVYAGLDKPVHLSGDPATDQRQPEPPEEDAPSVEDSSQDGPAQVNPAPLDPDSDGPDTSGPDTDGPAADAPTVKARPRSSRAAGKKLPGRHDETEAEHPGSSRPATEPSPDEPHESDAGTGHGHHGAASSSQANSDEAEPTSRRPQSGKAPQEVQTPLVETDGKKSTTPHPRKTSRRRRTHRATVPTWDEIMFGGPRPDVKGSHPHDKE